MSTLKIGPYTCVTSEKNFLGKGSFASVYKGCKHSSTEQVAVKIISYDKRSPIDRKYLDQEIKLMQEVQHPNVVSLLHPPVKENGMLYLVLEYCSGGDLKAYLDAQKSKRLDEDEARHFMCQIAAGLKYLHDKGIVHRDLKPHNMMLSENTPNAQLKICDFGFARKSDQMMTSFLGSPLYMAPEIIRNLPYSSKSDLWSVGCIFYEMLLGITPFNPKTIEDVRYNAEDPKPLDFKNLKGSVSPSCIDLLSRLLEKDGKKRIGWDEFFKHTYLQPKNLSSSISLKSSITKNKWLQTISCFYPCGRNVLLYLSPDITIEKVKNYLATSCSLDKSTTKDHLLLDANGQILEDNLTLESYGYNVSSTIAPIYFIPLALLKKAISIPDYPYPTIEEVVPPKVNVQDLDFLKKILEFAISVGIKHVDNCKLLKRHVIEYSNQIKIEYSVFKVLRHFVYKKCVELDTLSATGKELFITQMNMLDQLNLESTIQSLKSTTIDPKLSMKYKNLLELVDEPKLREIANNTTKEMKNLGNETAKITEGARTVKIQIETIMQGFNVQDIDASITNSFETTKERSKELMDLVKQFETKYNIYSHSNGVDKLFKTEEFNRIVKMTEELRKREGELLNIVHQQRGKKLEANNSMVLNIHEMGDILVKSEKIEEISNKTRVGLLNLQNNIDNLMKSSKLPTQFKDAIKELQRRKGFEPRVEKCIKIHEDYYRKIRSIELNSRQAFKQNFSNSLLYAVFPYLFIESNLPDLKINISPFDEELPPIDTELSELDDDFEFVSDSDPKEHIKALEEENSRLHQNIKKLKSETKVNTLIEQNQLLLDLNKQVQMFQKALQNANNASQNQDVLVAENEKMRKDILKYKKDSEDYKTKLDQTEKLNSNFNLKNQVLLAQIEAHQKTTEQLTKQIEELKKEKQSTEQFTKRIEELKKEKEDLEKTLLVPSLDSEQLKKSLKILMGMGFDEPIARKALLSNDNDVDRSINWLLAQVK